MTEHTERARDLRTKWIMEALEDGRDLVLPAGLLADITTALTAVEREAIERGKAEALADLDKRGLCIVPGKADRNMIEAMRATTKWGEGKWGDREPSAETWTAAVAAAK